jgi:RimJ/RimL family protein N-acetyltransferase
MFGNTVKISNGNLSLILRPPKDEDIPRLVKGMSDWEVKKYLGAKGAIIESTEREWVEKAAKDMDKMVWFIEPEGEEFAIGNTALTHITNLSGSCISGCMIWDKNWWGKGVASLAHIARTWFAGRQLGRSTITSEVYSPNHGSYKAIEKVGYIQTGVQLRVRFVDGKYIDKKIFTWLNPTFVPIMYPEGLPEEYKSAVQKAEEALQKGDEWIEFV